MRAVVFANGTLESVDRVYALIEPGDLIVAADGGGRHCAALGLTPAVVIGDLDSLTPELVRRFEAGGARIVRHPPRKDRTDLELALMWALDKGADRILVVGALGARWDMSLANVLLLADERLAGVDLRLAGERCDIFLVHGGRRISLQGRPGDRLSLLPLAETARGVTLTGLEYPLTDAVLPLGTTRAVSNVLNAATATVRLATGRLLCIFEPRPA